MSVAEIAPDQEAPPPAILNALADPVFVVGAGNEIVYLNLAAEQFFQTSMTALLGATLESVIPVDSPVLALIGKVRATGNSMSQYDVQMKTPRIGEHVVTIDAATIPDRPECVVITLQQRSIAGRIDRSLTHRGAARSVSAMALMLAHEIKNPLSGVRGAAQLLEQTSDVKDRELTRLIIEETDRICALVDRMEMFTDNPRIERRAVNIHEVLHHVVRLAQNGFGTGVRFVEAYDPSLPPAFGDRDQLIQIFLNLVKNAVEAAPEADGEVVISTAYQQGVSIATPSGDGQVRVPLVVRIQDNGAGVPDDLRGHLFDPFITTKPGGSGLGLALVAKFVGDHGGVIDLETQHRRTVFRVMLPMMDGADV
ncbi:MAG: PAS domain-containing protein [Alphaproteobacteria bacterium]|nr:PAS domain-containing protein [Alphaproteobacteria bacterium]